MVSYSYVRELFALAFTSLLREVNVYITRGGGGRVASSFAAWLATSLSRILMCLSI
jgi:hypothetical protein